MLKLKQLIHFLENIDFWCSTKKFFENFRKNGKRDTRFFKIQYYIQFSKYSIIQLTANEENLDN